MAFGLGMTILLVRQLASFAFAKRNNPIDQPRNHPAREIVAPSGISLDFGARHQARDVAAAGDRQQRVVLAVQDERRHLDGLELGDTIAREVMACSPGAGFAQSSDQIFQANSALSLPSMVAFCHGPESIRTSTRAIGAPQAAPMIR